MGCTIDKSLKNPINERKPGLKDSTEALIIVTRTGTKHRHRFIEAILEKIQDCTNI